MNVPAAWGRPCDNIVPVRCNYVEKSGLGTGVPECSHKAIHRPSPGPDPLPGPLRWRNTPTSTIHKPLLHLEIFLITTSRGALAQ